MERTTLQLCCLLDATCLFLALRLCWPLSFLGVIFLVLLLGARVYAILFISRALGRRWTKSERNPPSLHVVLVWLRPLTEVAHGTMVPEYADRQVRVFLARCLDLAAADSVVDMVALQRYAVRLASVVFQAYAVGRRSTLKQMMVCRDPTYLTYELEITAYRPLTPLSKSWLALVSPLTAVAPAPPPLRVHILCAATTLWLVLLECFLHSPSALCVVAACALLVLSWRSALLQRNERARAAFAVEDLDAITWVTVALDSIARSRVQLAECARARASLSPFLPLQIEALVLQFHECLPEFDAFIAGVVGVAGPPRPATTRALLAELAALAPVKTLNASPSSFFLGKEAL